MTEGLLDHGEGQGSTLLTGPMEGEFSAYEWPVSDASVIRVLAMDCDAGGVTWPGALLFYDEQAELVGTVWLEDLGEAHKGGFMLSGASHDATGLAVDYTISPGGAQFTEHRALISWSTGPEVVDTGVDDTDPGTDATESDDAGGEVIDVSGDAAFVSPSGNIACWLATDLDNVPFVACDIIEADYPIEVRRSDADPPGYDPAHCEEARTDPRTLVMVDEIVWECSHEPIMVGAGIELYGAWVGDGPTLEVGHGVVAAVLDYGQTLRTPHHECTSARDGVTCREREGEQGFRLSRGSFEVW